MNKAQEFRAEVERLEQLKKQELAAQKIKEDQERAAKKITDLPLDIELAGFLVARHQQEFLKGKERECKLVLGGDGKRFINYDDRADAPKTIASHHLNNDNLDEVAQHLRNDGFSVTKKWEPAWVNNDPDYRISGGDCYFLDVSW